MSWQSIDTQAQLDELAGSVCWDDSRALEYLAARGAQPYYPNDISRSGFECPDLHVLLQVCCRRAPFLELTFVHCDHIGQNAVERLSLLGHLDALKRVEVLSHDGSLLLRAARLVYRWLSNAPCDGTYYRRDSVASDGAD